MAKFDRASGLLLHPTSLPGPNGIGELSSFAYRWIDTLVTARQRVWQVLPLGPTGYGNSPYQTISSFAGNPLLIDLDWLVAEGLLEPADLRGRAELPQDRVDFARLVPWKWEILHRVGCTFEQRASTGLLDAFENFCRQHEEAWLEDFAFFLALKNHFGGVAWNEWPAAIRLRQPKAMRQWRSQLRGEIQCHKVIQFLFFHQWQALKNYANQKGIQIFGDIPIYATYDSADVWAHQELFQLDEAGLPLVVAGVPPDYFSRTGQLWGNPIYDWEKMRENGYRWWIARIAHALRLVDVVRVDHFRGFEAYWEVPFGEETAINGRWVKGPGASFFEAVLNALGDIPIVAEDLGEITPEVLALRDQFGFPGMKILQFAFASGPSDPFLPHNYTRNFVVYTGTHDNDTTHGWYMAAPQHEKEYCHRYLGGVPRDIAWALMRLASASVGVWCVFPVQDVLSLGSEARMNYPGRAEGNWAWRMPPNALQPHHIESLAEMSATYGR
ncbi:MAG: 4-alpha-glucanotransferase [Calditrichaeota bacterium]|nr:MAG: 4-alpha-glucanotransferase [Calditrichota bacterium]